MSNSPRHTLVEVGAGALLLDLHSGAVVALNEVATVIWRSHLAGRDITGIANELSAKYKITQEQAQLDTIHALNTATPVAANKTDDEFHYQRSADGYVLSRRGRPLLLVDHEGTLITPSPAAVISPAEARHLLFGVAPKLLSLRGKTVLHASAVAVKGGVLAFSGPSGAGKTTTARAIVRAGGIPVAEDKLIVTVGGQGFDVFLHGERAMDAWADQAASQIATGKRVSCLGLDAAAEGPSRRLQEIGFVTAARRHTSSIVARSLPPLDAAGEIFQGCFFGSDDPQDWARQLRGSASCAQMVDVYELTMPQTLIALDSVAAEVANRGSLKQSLGTARPPS